MSSEAKPPRDPNDELGFDLPSPPAVSKTRIIAIVLGVIVVLGAAFVLGYLPRKRERASLDQSAHAAASGKPRVEVALPKVGASDRAIVLPGSAQPIEETIVYPRVNGYVRKWIADLGDAVKAGQVLAEIETPELDQEIEQARAQLAQAQATLAQSKANRELSAASLARYKALAPSGVVAQQELEQRQAQAQVDEANVKVAEAAVRAQEANIGRLAKMKGFARIVAPYDGTVTMRSIERGALVSAGSTTPLYKIGAMDPMRVFVQVPQDVAPGVRADQPAKITVREYPGRTFDGKVTRAAGELDSATRTMTTVVSVPNPKREILPGMYVQVALSLPTPHRVLEIPATALMTDAHGNRVAIVDGENKIRLVQVVVDRDTGPVIEIASGLAPDARVVKIASVELVDGTSVDVM